MRCGAGRSLLVAVGLPGQSDRGRDFCRSVIVTCLRLYWGTVAADLVRWWFRLRAHQTAAEAYCLLPPSSSTCLVQALLGCLQL